jgi:hypothetical protein
VEAIIFFSFNQRLRLHYKPPEYGLDAVNQPYAKVPPKFIVFDNGRFTTDDPEKIKYIRGLDIYRSHGIWEIKGGDQELLKKSQEFFRQKAIRGPVDTKSTEGERKARFTEDGMPVHKLKVGEGPNYTSKCPIADCGKEFPNDTSGRKLAMHLVWHRRRGK